LLPVKDHRSVDGREKAEKAPKAQAEGNASTQRCCSRKMNEVGIKEDGRAVQMKNVMI
jgi:hypothetical protein